MATGAFDITAFDDAFYVGTVESTGRTSGAWLPKIYVDRDGNEVDINAPEPAPEPAPAVDLSQTVAAIEAMIDRMRQQDLMAREQAKYARAMELQDELMALNTRAANLARRTDPRVIAMENQNAIDVLMLEG